MPHENVLSIERLLSLLLGERSPRSSTASTQRQRLEVTERSARACRATFAPLERAARRAGVTRYHTCAERLVTEGGASSGYPDVTTNRLHAYLHAQLERWAIRCNPYASRWARRLRRWGAAWHRRFAQRLTLHAGSVLVTTGGFIYNRDRGKREAPSYRRGMPLGTIGCDGSGIAAEAVGAQTRHMDRISAWRFINPPLGFARGVLVDGSGRRFVNEALYGAALGEAIVERKGGRI